METLGLKLIFALSLLSFAPSAWAEPQPYVETASSEDTPKYLRINVAGYNIRTDTDFSAANTKNIDFKTAHGAVYAVRKMVNLQNGVAVNIVVNGQDRWVYMPNWRRHEFQYCDSEACFSDLGTVLKILSAQNITTTNLAECGIALNPDGSIIKPYLPIEVADIPIDKIPKPKFRPSPEKAEKELSPIARALSVARVTKRPLWETEKPGVGREWTAMLLKSLQTHGQGLINSPSLKDADYFCPNFNKWSGAKAAQLKQEFWVHLLNGMAKYESGFKTSTTFDESTYRNKRSGPIKPNTYSQGLFQLSYASAGQKAYRNFCKFNYAADKNKDISNSTLSIYDPKKQMDCAVGILNYWVKKDKGIGLNRNRGGARFWSTLRSTNPATARVRASLRNFSPCWSK